MPATRSPGTRLVVVRHGEHPPALESALDAGDLARLALETPAGRLRMLAGRAALLEAAARLSGVPAGALRIEARCPHCGRSHGRPRVVGAPAPVHLGLAHARGRAFAVAATGPVGIDAEARRQPPGRRAAVRAVAADVVGDPLRHWTAVEAILKADGRGLEVDPAEVAVHGRRGAVRGEPARYRLRTRRRHGCIVTIARLTADG